MKRQTWVAVMVLVLLGACSGDAKDSPSSPTPAPDTSSQDSTGPSSDAQLDVRDGLTLFVEPGGNIGCAIDREHARCDIAKRSWHPPKRPSTCDLDFGQGITMEGDHQARFVCAGDTTLGDHETLPEDKTIKVGSFGCHSTAGAMACTNQESGHGFVLSRTDYDMF